MYLLAAQIENLIHFCPFLGQFD